MIPLTRSRHRAKGAGSLTQALKHPRYMHYHPRATYGDALVDEVLAAQPDAVIWDTTKRGQPSLLPMTRDVCRDFAAEAVLVVSNKTATWNLVYGLEQLGVPAFGPIWDS